MSLREILCHLFCSVLTSFQVTSNLISAVDALARTQSPVKLTIFNAQSLMFIGKQECLVSTVEILTVDVCCVQEIQTQIFDPAIRSASCNSALKSHLHLPKAEAFGFIDISMALSESVETALPE